MAYRVICEACGQAMGNPACAVCRRSGGSQSLGRAEPARPPDPPRRPPAGGTRERRDPRRQHALQDGRRASDPTLTTRDVADRLGVSTAFVIGEIRDGRLTATVWKRDGKRAIYRIAPADLDDYERRHRWNRGRSAS
ncbi:MAG TPA: helix-turn-helix domain-containing protein [Vicinamibacterales bacterium]|nr:helix-turn-helix domain-containing protein [Vicinamibacterales bacterium]